MQAQEAAASSDNKDANESKIILPN
jgi:hypothetical protein